jgi:Dolichyl-phosphate-mannose-protein mannosyltransferase/Tetratricopeptide repeat
VLGKKRWVVLAVVVLLALQVLQMVVVLRGESLTWDEEDHMYAGYRMWKNGDFGINPEHPPLVKLLATLPVLTEKLWVPPLQGTYFRQEAYLGGRDWLEHNDGGSQRLVFRMRLAAGLLAIALALVVFFSAREWFGTTAALVALTLVVFDPNILAHSGLVTTDVGATLFFLASVWAFYRYVTRPSPLRLAIAGVVLGLLLATKHSGVLIGPMLLALVCWEIAVAPKGTRGRTALRLGGALAAIVLLAVGVLWGFYGFRYAARPAGLQLIPTLEVYRQSLNGFDRGVIWWMAHLHVLPESYLMGMVDVRSVVKSFNTYVLGTWYPHGVWWYFPAAITIKTTLGMLALVLLAVYAIVTGKSGKRREHARALVYVLFVWVAYLLTAILNGLNIGVRHILPLYALAAIVAGYAVAALAPRARVWAVVCGVLMAAHIVSALSVFPNSLAYANEAWGGARNAHWVLNDSNVDWGRQLIQVKEWEDRHPSEQCWFAYTVRPFIHPETYGVHCHVLPNGLGGAGKEQVPAVIHGSVLLSAAEIDGSLWPSEELNPYRGFRKMKPDEEIDYGVLVYRGDVPMSDVSGLSRAFLAWDKLDAKQPQEALALAEEAVKLAPEHLYAQWALGDAAAAAGKKDEARAAYQAAIAATSKLDPERRADSVKQLGDALKKL